MNNPDISIYEIIESKMNRLIDKINQMNSFHIRIFFIIFISTRNFVNTFFHTADKEDNTMARTQIG